MKSALAFHKLQSSDLKRTFLSDTMQWGCSRHPAIGCLVSGPSLLGDIGLSLTLILMLLETSPAPKCTLAYPSEEQLTRSGLFGGSEDPPPPRHGVGTLKGSR